MADDKRIVIEFVETSLGSVKAPSTNVVAPQIDNIQDNSDFSSTLSAALHPIRTLSNATIGKNVFVAQAYGYAKSALKSSIAYAINRNLNLREDYFAENTLNNTLNVFSKVSSLGNMVASGAIVGSYAGPIGAIAGATIGLVGGIGLEAIQGYQRFDQQQIRLNEMNYGSTFSLTRLGLVDEGRGTEN